MEFALPSGATAIFTMCTSLSMRRSSRASSENSTSILSRRVLGSIGFLLGPSATHRTTTTIVSTLAKTGPRLSAVIAPRHLSDRDRDSGSPSLRIQIGPELEGVLLCDNCRSVNNFMKWSLLRPLGVANVLAVASALSVGVDRQGRAGLRNSQLTLARCTPRCFTASNLVESSRNRRAVTYPPPPCLRSRSSGTQSSPLYNRFTKSVLTGSVLTNLTDARPCDVPSI